MRQRFWLRSTTDWNEKRFFEGVCGQTTRSGRCRLFVIAFEQECFFYSSSPSPVSAPSTRRVFSDSSLQEKTYVVSLMSSPDLTDSLKDEVTYWLYKR